MLTVKQVTTLPPVKPFENKVLTNIKDAYLHGKQEGRYEALEEISSLPVSMTLNRQKLATILDPLAIHQPLVRKMALEMADQIISELHNLWEGKQ